MLIISNKEINRMLRRWPGRRKRVMSIHCFVVKVIDDFLSTLSLDTDTL